MGGAANEYSPCENTPLLMIRALMAFNRALYLGSGRSNAATARAKAGRPGASVCWRATERAAGTGYGLGRTDGRADGRAGGRPGGHAWHAGDRSVAA